MSKGGGNLAQLNDLVSRVERLSNAVGNAKAPDLPIGGMSAVLDLSNKLWSQTAGADMDDASKQRSVLLLEAQGAPIPQLPDALLEARQPAEETVRQSVVPPNDNTAFLANRRKDLIVQAVEDALSNVLSFDYNSYIAGRMQKWRQMDQKFQSLAPPDGFFETVEKTLGDQEFTGGRIEARASTMSNLKMAFANEISSYVDLKLLGGEHFNLLSAMQRVANDSKDQITSKLWTYVSLLSRVVKGLPNVSPVNKDTSEYRLKFCSVVQNHLELVYADYLSYVVSERLEVAKLGGMPGICSLVHAYLNVIMPVPYPGYEDVLINGHPVWAVIYCCLRCGDREAAVAAADDAGPALADFKEVLKEFPDENLTHLSGETVLKLRLMYQRTVRLSSDPYKRAVYCSIVPCDPEMLQVMADTIEDWIWVHIRQAVMSEHMAMTSDSGDRSAIGSDRPYVGLEHLQKTVSDTYGESYFDQGSSVIVYFSALWLSGQFELAIEYLSRRSSKLFVQAVHVAIVVFDLGLLTTNSNYVSPLITVDTERSEKRLNLVQLILRYCNDFRTTNTRQALDYYYLLRDFKYFDGSDVFSAMFTRLVLETKEYWALLGHVRLDGTVAPGLAAKYNFNEKELIQKVAQESLKKGDVLLAVQLYDLAGEHQQAASTLADAIATTLLARPEGRKSVTKSEIGILASSIYTRYLKTPSKVSAQSIGLLKCMLDVMDYFESFEQKKYNNAFVIIRSLKFVPLSRDELSTALRSFAVVPDQVRLLLSDILISLMKMLTEEFKLLQERQEGFSGAKSGREVKEIAKLLVQYAGSIPHRLSSDAIGCLVQLQVSML
ncbi:nucleoporin interacting component [Trichuris suis]|nr:nucleoporin interacting component [Trichuris suis]